MICYSSDEHKELTCALANTSKSAWCCVPGSIVRRPKVELSKVSDTTLGPGPIYRSFSYAESVVL